MSNSANQKISVIFIHTKFSYKNESEKVLGEFIEDELYKRGITSKLPSFTDWGYVFRITFRKHEFDIIVEKIQNTESKFCISIDSTLSKIQKLFGKKEEYEWKGLAKIIDDILKVNAEFKEITWTKGNLFS